MPENSGYMVAAYVVTAVIYLGYTGTLWLRAKRAVKE
jgi:nucleoside recognition membrane protein YjiH